MRALFRYLLALAALLAIWQIGSLALGEFLLPRPLDVLAYFGAHSGNMPGPAPGGCSPP